MSGCPFSSPLSGSSVLTSRTDGSYLTNTIPTRTLSKPSAPVPLRLRHPMEKKDPKSNRTDERMDKRREKDGEGTSKRVCTSILQPILLSFFFCLRGGVTGRPIFMPPYGYLAFFSAGFSIWNEHSRVSSTLIIAPALSNSPQ